MNNERRPTPFEILAAILASVPQDISCSGSNVWRIAGQRDLRSPEGDSGEPFAIELSIEGHPEPYVIVLADRKDAPLTGDAPGGIYYRSIEFETHEDE